MKYNLLNLILVLALFSGVASCQSNPTSTGGSLSPIEFEKQMKNFSDKQIVDVRTPEEFNSGYIEGALLINFYDNDYAQKVNLLDKSKPVFVYCKAGGRSAEAAKQMRNAGFTTVFELNGGMMSWENAGKPIVKPTSSTNTTIEKKSGHLYSKADLDSTIKNSPIVLIDFYAKWCLPCRKMNPILEELAKEYQGKVTFCKVEVDDAKDLCKVMNVEAPPVLKVFVKGVETKSAIGFQTKEQIIGLLPKQ
jgi:thioredoxin 1